MNFSLIDCGGSFSSVLTDLKFGITPRIRFVCGARSSAVEFCSGPLVVVCAAAASGASGNALVADISLATGDAGSATRRSESCCDHPTVPTPSRHTSQTHARARRCIKTICQTEGTANHSVRILLGEANRSIILLDRKPGKTDNAPAKFEQNVIKPTQPHSKLCQQNSPRCPCAPPPPGGPP